MKLPLKWLDEHIKIDDSVQSLSHRLTMSGSKVETADYLGRGIENVVVGKIESVAKHESADRLSVCRVDVGGKTFQIVTGASNVKTGDLVPVALDGAMLPDGASIKSGMLRGVLSEGMLCSIKELGLTSNDMPFAVEDGILILTEGGSVGQDICEAVGLDDTVLDFEITPNRPDCLSVIGLAREAAATYGLSYTAPQSPAALPVDGNGIPVTIMDTDLCTRYTACVFDNVRIRPSPAWLRTRLRSVGIRPINNIVDITNYVMLEYGQPLHAFDRACLDGDAIVVRRARTAESIETLDGKRHELDGDTLVICDVNRPVAVAGVMGGANSEITASTRSVVLESANFNGVSVRLTAKRLGMRTEASGRFEKGLDPATTMSALNRVCQLIKELGAGDVSGSITDVDYSSKVSTVIPLDPSWINALLGTDIPAADMERMLKLLGFTVENSTVTVPSWRADVRGQHDLAEEGARLYGYDLIPSALTSGNTSLCPPRRAAMRSKIDFLCRSMGLDEILTYSLINPSSYDKIRLSADNSASLTLMNPLSEEMSVMRVSSLPSMLDALGRNYNHANAEAWFYEFATVYNPIFKDGAIDMSQLPLEKPVLTLGMYGPSADFFVLKGMVEALAEMLHLGALSYTACGDNPSYHPGCCAEISLNGVSLGYLGQIHPSVADKYALDTSVYLAEIDNDALIDLCNANILYTPLPKFPPVTRDLAVVCDRSLPVARLDEAIREGVGSILETLSLFDVYTGSPIAADKKSVAFSISMRLPDRTLTDADADAAISRALDILETRCAALLRR